MFFVRVVVFFAHQWSVQKNKTPRPCVTRIRVLKKKFFFHRTCARMNFFFSVARMLQVQKKNDDVVEFLFLYLYVVQEHGHDPSTNIALDAYRRAHHVQRDHELWKTS